MKKILIALSLSLFTIIALADNTLPAPQNSLKPIDQVAAIVNNEIITQSQVNKIYRQTVTQLQKQGASMPDKSTIKKELLNQLIYQSLQLQLAKRNHITVSDAQVTKTIQNIAKQHHVSVATLKRKIQGQGLPYPEYRKEIKKQILMSIIQHQALANKVNVSKAEIDQFIKKYASQKKFAKQYHIIDVLVPLPSASTATQSKQAKVKAMKIAKALRTGGDVLRIKGATVNDLGWQASTNLPDLFLNQVVKMKKNEVAGPLRASNGYHIIKLIGTRGSKNQLPTPEQAKRILQEQKFQKALKVWVKQLRKNAYIKIVTPQ